MPPVVTTRTQARGTGLPETPETTRPVIVPPPASAALIRAVVWPARTATRAAEPSVALPLYHWLA
jgi:hypothetical protein